MTALLVLATGPPGTARVTPCDRAAIDIWIALALGVFFFDAKKLLELARLVRP